MNDPTPKDACPTCGCPRDEPAEAADEYGYDGRVCHDPYHYPEPTPDTQGNA